MKLDEAESVLRRVGDRIAGLTGWRRCAAAFAAGAFGATAFPPFGIFPLLLVSYAVLVLLFDGLHQVRNPVRRAFFTGWWYGFGIFLVGMHWIVYPFFVDPTAHAWQMPFALVLFTGGLALFFAVASAAALALWSRGAQRIFLFALLFAMSEWLRGHVFTGLPWNLPAYGWGASLAVLQSASLFGAYGLSVLTLLFGASLALLARGRRAMWLPLAMTLLFVVLWVNGAVRLMVATDATVPNVRLRIVQPVTPDSEKYVPALVARNWQRLIDLSLQPAAKAPTHLIWPEAAPPFAMTAYPDALRAIEALTGNTRVLLTGDQRAERDNGVRYYNSFDLFGHGGQLLGQSDKFHLVPFGEYLPFEPLLKSLGLTEIAAASGFSAGTGPVTLDVPGAPAVTPIICYEAIFPQAVTGEPRPGWLVNLTDDAWFGPNAGPDQHFLIARVRAIEEGLPLVRAANTGISAIVDSYGRVRARLELGTRGALDGDLPVALPATPYATYGTPIFLMLIFLCAGAALLPLGVRRT